MFASNNKGYWKCIEPCKLIDEDTHLDNEPCHDCGSNASHFISAYTFVSTKRTVFLCGHCAKIANQGEQFIMNRDQLIVPDAEAALIDVDTWAISSFHGPGNMNIPGLWLPNRMVIVRLKEKKQDESNTISSSKSKNNNVNNGSFLVALNQLRPDKEGRGPFACLRQLEQRTGSKLKYIVSIDSYHNLYLTQYAQEFPDALVVYPPGRVQREIPALAKLENARPMDYEEPLPELVQYGLNFHIVRGMRERAIDLNGRPKFGTVEGVLVYFEKTKTLFQGSHAIWVIPSRSEPNGMGKLFQMLVGKPGTMTPTPGKGSALNVSIWDLDLFKKAVAKICGTAKGWEWEYYADFHMSPNVSLQAERDRPKIEKAFEYLNNVESLEIKPLEIPEGYISENAEGYNNIPANWKMVTATATAAAAAAAAASVDQSKRNEIDESNVVSLKST